MQRMLNGILKLGDIEDVEMFCNSRIESYLQKRKMYLNAVDKEDLLSYALSQVWEAFDSKWNQRGEFSGYASYILPMRITDYFRQKWGKNGQKLPIETAAPLSSFGKVESGFSEYDQTISASDVSRVLLR